MSHQRSQRRAAPLANAVLIFNCKICDKGYSRQNDFDAHLSSYDHSHRQRMVDLKNQMGAISGASSKRPLDDATAMPSGMEGGVKVQRTGAGGFRRIQDLPKEKPAGSASEGTLTDNPIDAPPKKMRGFRKVAGIPAASEGTPTDNPTGNTINTLPMTFSGFKKVAGAREDVLEVRKEFPAVLTVTMPEEPRMESPHTAPIERKKENAYLPPQNLLKFNAPSEEIEQRKAASQAKRDAEAAVQKAEEEAKKAEEEARKVAEEKAKIAYQDQLFADDDEISGQDSYNPFVDHLDCPECDETKLQGIYKKVFEQTKKPDDVDCDEKGCLD